MLPSKKTVGIYTLGCKVNQYESEAIAEALEREGLRIAKSCEKCDAYIINTCTVTAESDRKARQFIRRAIAKNPDAVVVVTGCFAEVKPEALLAIEGVDAVIGNAEKMEAVRQTLRLLKDKTATSPIVHRPPLADSPFEPMCIRTFGRTRAYVKIEDGCENRCTYCIIPNARGFVRSKPMSEVLEEVCALTDGGCREVVLTGIETASYGKDLENTDLASLLCKVDQIPNIGRVRLGSLDPSLIREEFVRRIAPLSSLAPHFHLSLQSGSSRTLARMKRKYNAEQAMAAIDRLRAHIPNVQFTTDVIVGFPGETEQDFEETLDFVRRARFLNVHVFPYSPRAGTPAARMPEQIPEAEKSARLHRLCDEVAAIRAEILSEIASEQPVMPVLFETKKGNEYFGHTASFLEVAVTTDVDLRGKIYPVRLCESDGQMIRGNVENP